MKYIIAWKSLKTDAKGQGCYPLDETTAKQLCDRLNREWAGVITHWLEEVKP